MIAIHQPNYLPWLGFFDKARKADTLVLLDCVPYTRGSVINRNRIKTKKGWEWITVPVHHHQGEVIRDILTLDSGWESDHWKTLTFTYSRAPHFKNLAPLIQEVYAERWTKLAEINEILIRTLLNDLGFHPRILRASDLQVRGERSALLISICKALHEQEYLSGSGAKQYLDLGLFHREGINVRFQEFASPEYPQLFEKFIPDLSAIDYVFNCSNRKWWAEA